MEEVSVTRPAVYSSTFTRAIAPDLRRTALLCSTSHPTVPNGTYRSVKQS